MKQQLLLLLIIYAATGHAQHDTLKQNGSYIICLDHKSDCKPGSVTDNERLAIADTSLALVSGLIVNAQNEGIPFAELSFTDIQSGSIITCTTNPGGIYKTWIRAGKYHVTAACFRYKPLELPLLSLGTGQMHLLNMSLGESCCRQTKMVIKQGTGSREEYSSGQLCKRPAFPVTDQPFESGDYIMPDSIVSYWTAKQKRSQAYMRNCLPAGTYTEWHENGLLKSRGAYNKGGQKTGDWLSWNSNGLLTGEEYYRQGIAAGVWVYYNNSGQIISTVIHKRHGASITTTISLDAGHPIMTTERLYRDGSSQKTVFDPAHSLTTTEKHYANGRILFATKKNGKDYSRYACRLNSRGKLEMKKME